jgi:hypothetical protein
MVTSVTKGKIQKLAKKFKIVETYWLEHSLESSWWALSEGTISFSIQLFPGENAFSEFFSKKFTDFVSSFTGRGPKFEMLFIPPKLGLSSCTECD